MPEPLPVIKGGGEPWVWPDGTPVRVDREGNDEPIDLWPTRKAYRARRRLGRFESWLRFHLRLWQR